MNSIGKLLIAIFLGNSAFSANAAVGQTTLKKTEIVTAQSVYGVEENALKDNKLQMENKCFNDLKGSRLLYISNSIIVISPPLSNVSFGKSYDIKSTALCLFD